MMNEAGDAKELEFRGMHAIGPLNCHMSEAINTDKLELNT